MPPETQADPNAKINRWGLWFSPLMKMLDVHLHFIRKGGRWKEKGRDLGNGLEFHFKEAMDILWPNEPWHRWRTLLLESFCNNRIISVMGPASCVAGHTRILDPITGLNPTIEDLYESDTQPMVMTLHGPRLASVPFVKGVDELFEVKLTNGKKFTSTGGHLVLCAHGFVPVSSLSKGQFLCEYLPNPPYSISEYDQSIQPSGVHRWNDTTQDSQSGYLSDFCSCDEPLHEALKNDPDIFPLRSCVPKHKGYVCAHVDDLDNKLIRNRLDQHFYRHAKFQTSHLCNALGNVSSCFPLEEKISHGVDSSEPCWQSEKESIHLQPFLEPNYDFYHNDQFQVAPCPQYRVQRTVVESIKQVGRNVFYDLQVPMAHHYFAEGMIHHNSGKSHDAAQYLLIKYYAFHDCCTILVGSTEIQMLNLRIFGEIKKYHKMARRIEPSLPGYLIESKQMIVSDLKTSENEGRDFRNGIIGVPYKKGSAYQGLGSLVGVKNKNVELVVDESSLIPRIFVDAISNLNKNAGFHCIVLGNPKDTTDALGVISEPAAHIGGWDGGIDQTGGTKTWPNRYKDGITVQLVGSDCPNMDVPEGQPVPFPFLITREAINADVQFYGKDSLHFTMMNEARMPRGMAAHRVITRNMCLKFGAMEEPIWDNEKRTVICFMDASDGGVGGDRSVFGELQFGLGLDGTEKRQILSLIDTMVIPTNSMEGLITDQIALWVRDQCEQRKCPPENFFFDTTGRGALMNAFARLWNPNVQGIEFGGSPSDGMAMRVNIPAKDYYDRRVSELWYEARELIEARQFRGMTEEVMQEGCFREWGFSGKKISVETKDQMKLKCGRSPDLFDALVAGISGAKQRGFAVQMKLSNFKSTVTNDIWKSDLRRRSEKLRSTWTLT